MKVLKDIQVNMKPNDGAQISGLPPDRFVPFIHRFCALVQTTES